MCCVHSARLEWLGAAQTQEETRNSSISACFYLKPEVLAWFELANANKRA